MPRRTWMVVFACWLSAGLVTGCALTRGHEVEVLIASDDGKPPPDPPPSPYHARDERRTETERPRSIRQVEYVPKGSASDAGPVPPVFPDNPTDPARRSSDAFGPALIFPLDPVKSAPEKPIVEAMKALQDKRLEDAVRALKCYDEADQKELLRLLPWVTWLAEGGLKQGKPDEVEKFLYQLEELSQSLRPRARLALGKIGFCRDVRGYGMIDPWPEKHVFQSGNDSRTSELVMLYVEVRNTACRRQGLVYETSLAGKAEILDARGHRVWGQVFPAEANASVSPRHDYFIVFRLLVPENLQPGHYRFSIELTDQTWSGGSETPPHRTARGWVDFDVARGTSEPISSRPTAAITPAGGVQR